jgi:hypothetical protein
MAFSPLKICSDLALTLESKSVCIITSVVATAAAQATAFPEYVPPYVREETVSRIPAFLKTTVVSTC